MYHIRISTQVKKVAEIEFYSQIKVLSLQVKSATYVDVASECNIWEQRRTEWMNEWST